MWENFRKYHYLNANLSVSSKCYVALYENMPVGFIAIQHFPHPKAKNIKHVHRLVVLPDYQGVGIGIKLLNFIGKRYLENKQRYSIVTSTPALVYGLKQYNNWALTRYGKVSSGSGKIHNKNKKGSTSCRRFTTTWEMIN